MPILKGLLIGLSTAFILGPVFFTLLRNSLQKSVLHGILTALGILVSDILVAAICYLFAGPILSKYVELPILKLVAAGILLFFSFTFIRNPIQDKAKLVFDNSRAKLTSFGQGFIVNFANPAVFLLWITFIASGKSSYSTLTENLIYILGILIGVFTTDFLKALGAAKLAPLLSSSVIRVLFKLLGIILIIISLYLVHTAYISLF
jgi:threonine/homoserine/homoserine lactone efflux protein